MRVHRPSPDAFPVLLDDEGKAGEPIENMKVVDDPNKVNKTQAKAQDANPATGGGS